MKLHIDIEELKEGGFKVLINREIQVPSDHPTDHSLISKMVQTEIYDNKSPGALAKTTRRIKAIYGEGKADGTTV